MKDNDQLEPYRINGVMFTPEWSDCRVTRVHVSGVIHGMTVSDTYAWDEVMHPQVNRLQDGETAILESDAWEYLKVTKVGKNLYDIEYGFYGG